MPIPLVRQAAEEHGIVEPCAIDNNLTISSLYETDRIWPYYFLFDAEGKMRCRAAGTIGLRLVEDSLRRLIKTSAAT